MGITGVSRLDNRRTFYAGKDDTGDRVYVTIEVTQRNFYLESEAKLMMDIHHQLVTKPWRLSFSGFTLRPRYNVDSALDTMSGGQIIESLREVTQHGRGKDDPHPDIRSLSSAEVHRIARLWERWHLNDMRAGCAHVPVPLYEDKPYRRPDLVNTPACPVTGYRYGTAWLYEDPGTLVLQQIRQLLEED